MLPMIRKMNNQYSSGLIESVIQKNYFPRLEFVDKRERKVFFSYIRGFSPIIFDLNIQNILEIGGGQSTYLLCHLANRLNFSLSTIDMNPLSIKNKLKSLEITEDIIQKINFIKGYTISPNLINKFYEEEEIKIGKYKLEYVLKYSEEFIDISLDDRKVLNVCKALNLQSFNFETILKTLSTHKKIPKDLLDVYRTKYDEFNFSDEYKKISSCLEKSLKNLRPNAIFLDSGEFSSLLEWNLVYQFQQKGDYIILHDIFFPKSIKNWLVAASIKADPSYEILYIDRSTPQGFLIAMKKKNN